MRWSDRISCACCVAAQPGSQEIDLVDFCRGQRDGRGPTASTWMVRQSVQCFWRRRAAAMPHEAAAAILPARAAGLGRSSITTARQSGSMAAIARPALELRQWRPAFDLVSAPTVRYRIPTARRTYRYGSRTTAFLSLPAG